MAKKKPQSDKPAFTKEFYLQRTGGNWDEYEFLEIADYDSIFWELPASLIHEAFQGIARWFHKPPDFANKFSKRRRARVTIEILD